MANEEDARSSVRPDRREHGVATGMNSLTASKLSGLAARDSMLTGNRFDAPGAVALGIVDAAAAEELVVENAADSIRPLASRPGDVFARIRRGMSASVIDSLPAEARTAREG